jgi:glycine oxidase
MRTWDVILVGGGIIGLSLAIELRKCGVDVLIVERGEPGREASHAAAGMLADCTLETPTALQTLATASARMYPEFVHELQDESGADLDLRSEGTLLFPAESEREKLSGFCAEHPLPATLAELEPAMVAAGNTAAFLNERSVDPRALVEASLKAAKHRGVNISSGTTVVSVLIEEGRAAGVQTDNTVYRAAAVVNCAGAWSGLLLPATFPTRPVKGQMLALVGGPPNVPRHVIRTSEVYLVPRSNGRLLVGTTVEDAGYDKQVEAHTIQRLRKAAMRLFPALADARLHENWAGLRPGTPDHLPILGATQTPGYFIATGHFRDGILLAPVTAKIMAQVITGQSVDYDLSAFAPARFGV